MSWTARSQTILPNTVYCVKGSEAHTVSYCTDATPCKVFNGVNVCLAGAPNPPADATMSTSSCWSMATDYTCMQYQDSCATYTSDANCTELGSKACSIGADGKPMVATNPKTGTCSSYTRNFSCIDPRKPKGDSYTSTTQCDTTGLQNGLSWTSSSQSAAGDFVLATTGQEFARQLSTYGAKDSNGINNLFPGHPYGCRVGDAGIKNCCKSSGGGAVSDHSMAQNIGTTVAMAGFKEGAGYAIAAGSNFIYSTILTNAPELMTAGLENILAGGAFNSMAGSGFGAFGIGTTADAAGGFFGGASSMAIGNTGMFFNPYALAAAVAIQIVMEAMSCTQDEMDLQRARALDLCHPIGDYCSNEVKVFGVVVGCLETTQSYCCFNGLLGKAIEEGAHDQLGLGWGTPASPNCNGLTPSQITTLDFDAPAMQTAMEPFKQQIMKNFQAGAAPVLANGSVQSDITNTANSTSHSLCLQRKKMDSSTVC